ARAGAVADGEGLVAATAGYAASPLERPEEIYRAGLNTTRLLMALGDLVIGWLLARQAEVALATLDSERADHMGAADRAFYQGKLASARVFAQTVLPRLAVERETAETA